MAAPLLVRGLKRMEYRGYDSVGVATKDVNGISLRKGVGRVADVNESVGLDTIPGAIGIGHTRWASHGSITDGNAHPHASSTGGLALVHNGIAENYMLLKKELQADGFTFKSETDSEVLANLLQRSYDRTGSILEAVRESVRVIGGEYAFVAMFADGTLAAARFHKPLIIGVGTDSHFFASDVVAFVEKTDDVIYMEDRSIAIVDGSGLRLYGFDGRPVQKQVTKISKEFADVYKGEFAHYTLKEIHEQPDTILRSCRDLDKIVGGAARMIRESTTVYITGSGTSYNAAIVAKHLLTRYAKVKVETIMASEMSFLAETLEPGAVLIAISQSGESADVLEAMRIAKEAGVRTIAIVNMLSSSLAQKSSYVVPMNCGPERGVAATKSFTSQLAALYRIVENLCDNCLDISFEEISLAMASILSGSAAIKGIANELKDVTDIYVLGRGVHYPIAAEAALKLKELTYIHAEGIAGGELKHGPLALIDSRSYAIVVNPNDATYKDMQNSTNEIKARGARVIGISDSDSNVYDSWIRIPKVPEHLYPIIEIVPIQLLSYYTALEKDTDPDYPRNLAKSVTVL